MSEYKYEVGQKVWLTTYGYAGTVGQVTVGTVISRRDTASRGRQYLVRADEGAAPVDEESLFPYLEV